MPVYDFRCQQCGKVVEVFQRTNEVKGVHCPDCGSQPMEKLFSPAYFVMKNAKPHGVPCCGREERCEKPPCSEDCSCHRG